MAIIEMKKIKLAAMKSDRRKLLKELIALGCVHLSQLSLSQEELGEIEAVNGSSNALELRGKLGRIQTAIDILATAVPEKGGLLTAKPEEDREVILEDEGIDEAVALAEEIIGRDDKIKKIITEESILRGNILALSPWLDLDMNLQIAGTERSSVIMGSIVAKTDTESVRQALWSVTDEAELYEISSDRTSRYVLIICINEALSQIQTALKPFVFVPSPVAGLAGSPKEATAAAETNLLELAAEKQQLTETIAGEAGRRDELKLAADRLGARIEMAEACEKLGSTRDCILMQGWIPAEEEQKLSQLLDKYDCAYDTEEPSPDEYDKVPVKLKNNKFTNALNMVTNMYSLPLYGTVDPNPLMAPFFVLFYGLMMADMGYGLIMIAAAIVAFKKLKPRGGTLSFCQLLLYGGISTFICGALTGGFFSDVISQFVTMATGTEWSMPYLFSPVNDSELVLYGSLVLGVIHLNTGMAINFVQKLKRGETASAIWDEGSLWVILIGGILWFLDILNIAGIPVILIIGCVMLLLGAGRESKGFGKVTAAVACIYNTSTGWLGDVLSYARIMALMLAGGVVGQVFNSVAIMPMQESGVNVVTVIVFIVIFLAGHAMNFALNILGCYVHDLRLQCLEFFGKFYTDGGQPFTPLEVKDGYNRIKM